MPHLIIKQRRPFQLLLAVVILSLLLSTTIWFLLDEGHWTYIKSRVTAGKESKKLWEINRQLEEDNENLRERLIMLERTTQIDGQTAALLQEELMKLQDEIYQLKGELEFYQGIMTATRASDGLNIQGLMVEKLTQPQNYRFKLILTHVSKSDKVVEGNVEMALTGHQGGTTKEVNIKDLLLNKAMDLSFKFKNFKRFEGRIKLPEGFVPNRIIVRLHSKDKNLSKTERIFDWSETTG